VKAGKFEACRKTKCAQTLPEHTIVGYWPINEVDFSFDLTSGVAPADLSILSVVAARTCTRKKLRNSLSEAKKVHCNDGGQFTKLCTVK